MEKAGFGFFLRPAPEIPGVRSRKQLRGRLERRFGQDEPGASNSSILRSILAGTVRFELGEHFGFRRRSQQADDYKGNQAKEEAGNDLIQVENTALELRPNDGGQTADDNAGISAVFVRALPEQRAQDDRPNAEPKPAHA